MTSRYQVEVSRHGPSATISKPKSATRFIYQSAARAEMLVPACRHVHYGHRPQRPAHLRPTGNSVPPPPPVALEQQTEHPAVWLPRARPRSNADDPITTARVRAPCNGSCDELRDTTATHETPSRVNMNDKTPVTRMISGAPASGGGSAGSNLPPGHRGLTSQYHCK